MSAVFREDFFDKLAPAPALCGKEGIKIEDIARFFAEEDNFLLVAHARPDGDALGSLRGLQLALRAIGKRAEAVSEDRLGRRLGFLFDSPDGEFLRRGEEEGESFLSISSDFLPKDFYPRHIVSLDCASVGLLGADPELLADRIALKIDHHRTGESYAAAEYVEPTASSCGEIVFNIVDALGVFESERVDEDTRRALAAALYVAVICDCGSFAYSCAGPETHIAAAKLLGTGFDHSALHRRLFETKTRGEIEGMRACLGAIRYGYDGKMAMVVVDNAFKEENGISDEDIGDINSIPRTIEGVELGITIKQSPPPQPNENGELPVGADEQTRKYRISMRSNAYIDVSSICALLGGGGHARASGAAVTADSTDEAVAAVLAAVEEAVGSIFAAESTDCPDGAEG